MDPAMQNAIKSIYRYNADLSQGLVFQSLESILTQFFRDRVVEILAGLDKRDALMDEMSIKIGGTD